MGWLQTWNPDPVAFALGRISVEWYGVLVVIAVLVGFFIGRNFLLTKQVSDEHVYGLLFWLLVSGIIGGRIGHMVGEWQYYAANLGEMLQIWHGGLAIHGALIAGGITVYLYCKKARLPFWAVLDVLLIVTPLMQAIGRWGNYFNQELFGLPTGLPWGIAIALEHRPVDYITQTHFHPLFLYESLALLVLFMVLYRLYKKNVLHMGQYALLYMIIFSAVRFCLDFLRIDMLEIGPLLLTQWLGLLLLIGAFRLWRRLPVKNS